MNTDDLRLQRMLDNSVSDNDENEYWFSRQNQNKMVLNVAAKLYVANPSISVEDSIKKAQDLINTFYKMVLQKTTKQYKG
jgi:anthranilate phosphoribosyltransferase